MTLQEAKKIVTLVAYGSSEFSREEYFQACDIVEARMKEELSK